MELPRPEVHLGIGGGGHGAQTGRMLEAIEKELLRVQPDWVIVFGDTNSTVAGALAAAKLNIPVAHIEAGLRSFDRTMPEEVNRVVTDHISAALFCPTDTAVQHLKNEGILRGVHQVGDVRVDVIEHAKQRSAELGPRLQTRAGLQSGEEYAFSTIHRASNTDEPERLKAVLSALGMVPCAVVLPVHPRLKNRMTEFGLAFPANVRTLAPTSFFETIALMQGATLILTDSGGLQKEAYMLGKPTITLRDTTEWTETVDAGWNRLAEPDPASMGAALESARVSPAERPNLYGQPGVAERIAILLEQGA